jgi:hypothetical protein
MAGTLLNQFAIEALLDDDQPRLEKLLHVAHLAYALVCPECGGKEIETNDAGDEACCLECEEHWSPQDVAAGELMDMGYNVEVG